MAGTTTARADSCMTGAGKVFGSLPVAPASPPAVAARSTATFVACLYAHIWLQRTVTGEKEVRSPTKSGVAYSREVSELRLINRLLSLIFR